VPPLKCLFLAAALLAACAAHAQVRSIPAEARPATLRHVQDMIVELDGRMARLSPGAQIRDPFNRLVLPVSLAAGARVRYLADASGMLHRVWILSPEEEAKLPRAPAKTVDRKAGEKAQD
jgi:hypothetical protein